MKQTNIIELKIPDAMGDIGCVRRNTVATLSGHVLTVG